MSSSLYQVVEISRLETRYQSSVSVEVEGTLTMSDPKPSSELLTQITGPYNLLVFGIWRPFLVTGQFVIISQFNSLNTRLTFHLETFQKVLWIAVYCRYFLNRRKIWQAKTCWDLGEHRQCPWHGFGNYLNCNLYFTQLIYSLMSDMEIMKNNDVLNLCSKFEILFYVKLFYS